MVIARFFSFVVPDLTNGCILDSCLTVKCFDMQNDDLRLTCVTGYSWQCVKHKELLSKKLSMNLIMFISLVHKRNAR